MDRKLPPIKYVIEAATLVLLMAVLTVSDKSPGTDYRSADMGAEVFSAEHPRQIWVSLTASYLPPQLAA